MEEQQNWLIGYHSKTFNSNGVQVSDGPVTVLKEQVETVGDTYQFTEGGNITILPVSSTTLHVEKRLQVASKK